MGEYSLPYELTFMLLMFLHRNQSVVKSVQEKLSNLETYKSQLKASEQAIGQQKNQRHAHKKLTIF